MASKKITQTDKTFDKEKMLTAVIEKLRTSLSGLKENLSEKKFEKRITRAAELLVHGIKTAPTKNVIAVKKKIAKSKSKD